ncbi:MAG TPA: endonuclease III [Paralcaligenes sp.]
MNHAKRVEIFARLRAANPAPTTELKYAGAFQLLIAVMLSAQATDKSVNLATAKFFPEHGTPEGLIGLGQEALAGFIKTIGLYRTKAKNIIKTCEILLEQYHGVVPDDRQALQALPGVGRKTANVILNTAFGHAVIAVDTHIFRVANRTGLARGKTVIEVERKLEKAIPSDYLLNAHHWLILHGRYICVARKPKCPQCAIADLCEYKHKTRLP